MITIFCDFCQFLANKLAFFSKTNVMIKILHCLALFRVKNAIFFGENILKIITLVPGLACYNAGIVVVNSEFVRLASGLVSYNDNAVKIYNATISFAHFNNIFFLPL
jgi:hypothetical protein